MKEFETKTLEPGGRIFHRYLDRTNWDQGEWDSEPDICVWRDVWTEYYCMASRHPNFGAWCGYVGIPSSHPMYGSRYDSASFPDFSVHGGVTYSSFAPPMGVDKVGDQLYWIGFDCVHYCDLMPCDYAKIITRGTKAENRENEIDKALETLGGVAFKPVYRDLIFVRTECEALARQLKERETI